MNVLLEVQVSSYYRQLVWVICALERTGYKQLLLASVSEAAHYSFQKGKKSFFFSDVRL